MDDTEREQMENFSKSQAVKELNAEHPERNESASERLQETEEVKRKLKKTLLGMEEKEQWSEEKGDWETVLVDKEDIEPLINRQGLEDLWTIAEPVISETAAGSNLSERDVALQIFQSIKQIVIAVMVKNEEYGIEDTEDASIIIYAFLDPMINNLKKAEGGRLLTHHEESTQRKVFRTEGDTDSGGSSWNPFS